MALGSLTATVSTGSLNAGSLQRQQLAVLRNQGIVSAQKEGLSVRYTLRDPLIGELLDVARRIFDNHLGNSRGLLRELRRESR